LRASPRPLSELRLHRRFDLLDHLRRFQQDRAATAILNAQVREKSGTQFLWIHYAMTLAQNVDISQTSDAQDS
jgi:hypothetical protein